MAHYFIFISTEADIKLRHRNIFYDKKQKQTILELKHIAIHAG